MKVVSFHITQYNPNEVPKLKAGVGYEMLKY